VMATDIFVSRPAPLETFDLKPRDGEQEQQEWEQEQE
jgi:hypothetical protein